MDAVAGLQLADHTVHFPHLIGAFDLGDKDEIRRFGDDFGEVLQAHGQLVNTDHAFTTGEVDSP